MNSITGSATELLIGQHAGDDGLAVGFEGGLQVSEGAVELHAIGFPMLVGGEWFVSCSCGWHSGGTDALQWIPAMCEVELLETRRLFNRRRLEAAIARQQGQA